MSLNADTKIGWNEKYITVNGRPHFPVMGEIHYTRVKRECWERELLKMKAGGVDVVSAYVIWIHHEEIEGQWDFDGVRDLRAFVETVKRCGLALVLRIGPWAHGEVRNGGFPDWLVQKEREGQLQLRCNDAGYLALARKWYEKVYAQVEGLFLKDGGPTVGVQIENEYGHCGGLGGEEGERHMRTLLAMAQEIGFDVPVYTATGWGGAVTGGMLPVMGGYCEAPWDQRTTEIEPSGNYIFTRERNDHNIGSDYGLGAGITFDMDAFPYLTAELGGGLQVTKHRRPIASSKDTIGMSLVKLGSGCNLLGYYMYHGGTNPEGRCTTLQESRATGYPNDLPVLSYDFNAPIREYGQLTDTYREIRRLAMFVRDYADLLCRTDYVPQPGNPAKPQDLSAIRSAVRMVTDHGGDIAAKEGGFYFVNNYQRRYKMAEHDGFVPIACDEAGRAAAVYEPCMLRDGDMFFRPFNLQMGEAVLRTTNAIPMCILNSGAKESVYVFYVRDGEEPYYEIEGDAGRLHIITLTDEEALHASKISISGSDYLVISEGDIVPSSEGGWDLLLQVEREKQLSLRSYPALDLCPQGFVPIKETTDLKAFASGEDFAAYLYEEKLVNTARAVVKDSRVKGESLQAQIEISKHEDNREKVDELLLKIAYAGESGELMKDGKLLADSFYTGQVWEIGVTDLAQKDNRTCQVCIHGLTEQDRDHLYLQTWPDMEDGRACRIEQVDTCAIMRVKFL